MHSYSKASSALSTGGEDAGYRPRLSWTWIFQDFAANKHRPRSRLLLAAFRTAQAARWPFDRSPNPVSYVTTAAYVLLSEWVLGVEIPVKTIIGPQLQLVHLFGIVVNVDAKLGTGVILRQHVTLGNRGEGGPSPTLRDRVSVGAGAIVLGGVEIGAGARIGAGAIVVHDVPDGATIVGPAAVVRDSPPSEDITSSGQ